MQYPELRNKKQNYVGTTGLIYFGESLVLSFTRDYTAANSKGMRDLAGGSREGSKENPFITFARELDEQFDLGICFNQITYAQQYPSHNDPSRIGYFVVGQLDAAEAENVRLGDKGLAYHVSTVEELLQVPTLIPRRKLQIETFLAQTAVSQAA